MDITTVTQLINSVGFPIVMCGALFWWMQKSEIRHVDEVNQLRESINKNTDVMERLLDRIDASYPRYKEEEK